uniref:Uncharacterized protein n=1 Tax=Glossina austeni TaxID=7395 RepID=A0A1A9VIE6_GLOAU
MGYPLVKRYGSSEASQDLEIAKLFGEFFQKSYPIIAMPVDAYPYHSKSFDIVGLSTLKPSCVPDPDGIAPSIVRNSQDMLDIPLMHIFNNCNKTRVEGTIRYKGEILLALILTQTNSTPTGSENGPRTAEKLLQGCQVYYIKLRAIIHPTLIARAISLNAITNA